MIVPKTLPKTLPRYGVATGAVLISLSILAHGRCLRVTPSYSSLRRLLHRYRRQQGRTLDTARRGAVPTAPIGARADCALDAHRLLCHLGIYAIASLARALHGALSSC